MTRKSKNGGKGNPTWRTVPTTPKGGLLELPPPTSKGHAWGEVSKAPAPWPPPVAAENGAPHPHHEPLEARVLEHVARLYPAPVAVGALLAAFPGAVANDVWAAVHARAAKLRFLCDKQVRSRIGLRDRRISCTCTSTSVVLNLAYAWDADADPHLLYFPYGAPNPKP